MRVYAALVVVLLLLLSACAVEKPVISVPVSKPEGSVDYLTEIKPILDKRCSVCHSCYNSPCQLKLSSYDGLDRGATKKEVYDSSRLWSMEPTRLFVDAGSTKEWREKGFHSVTESSAEAGQNNSFLLKVLDQKRKMPESACSDDVRDPQNSYKPEDDELTCAATGGEMDEYLKKHPNRGMPYGFPPLAESEFERISTWLETGAQGPSPEEHAERSAIGAQEVDDVDTWETFLNESDAKHRMTARYLYEHLFLAHISFSPTSNNFYELVRSRTPPGEKIEIIPTIRPYDDPGEGAFYYRFRRIYSTIVHKTHMVFELNDDTLQRYNELFIEPRWLREPAWVGFDKKQSANPFAVFEQIPPRSRYQFLLDNSQYIIMTFIRGPVCKGQVALNVIRDHFWLLFMDPDYDLAVQHPGFLHDNLKLTRIPTEQGSFFSIFKGFMVPIYQEFASRYVKARQEYYNKNYGYRGLNHKAIWAGDSGDDAPVLTVFRHFNSASVHKGALGDLPRTIWVMDFPLLERIYYALVAGFDVYGSVGHQVAVRMYMDNLRQEGETYFLDFLPAEVRSPLMQEWYGGMSLSKIRYQPSQMPAGREFTTSEPKREFIEYLIRHHLNPDTGIDFDENYREAGEEYPVMPEFFNTEEEYIRGFHAASAPGNSFFRHVKDHDANLAYVRIRISDEKSEVVSMVIHRWHDDVRTLSREEDKLNAEKDEVDFIRGYVGSYPNYFFDVTLEELPQFLKLLQTYDGSNEKVTELLDYGVNRANGDFWTRYDWFQQDFIESDRLRAGLFDLNRYYHLAVKNRAEPE
jgi:hypothetical protein